MNALDEADALADALGQVNAAGWDNAAWRQSFRDFARRLVLACAAVCDERARSLRAKSRSTLAGEAGANAILIRNHLLCHDGEHCCYRCNGAGCPTCRHRGVVSQGVQP